MAPLADIFLSVRGNTALLRRDVERGAAEAGTVAGKAFNTAFIASGVLAVGVGVVLEKSIKAAGDFQAAMVRLTTSAGETGTMASGNLRAVSEGILDMAAKVGTSVADLSRAMYTIESGSFHGAEGLKVLRAAAEGAKAENADLKLVADAVTSALVDYHLTADSSAAVTTKLVAATAAGKTTFAEMTGSLHSVLPAASAAHISLDDILGDLASMTLHGMSADQATQNLTDVIRHMQAPTAVQAKELALLGLTTNQLATDLRDKGLSGTLQEISDRIVGLMPPGSDRVIADLRTALASLPPEVQKLGQQLVEGTITAAQYRQESMRLDPVARSQAASFAAMAGATHRIGDEQVTAAEVLQTYGGAMQKATGDATGMNVALMLTGENAGVTNNAIKAVSDATTEAGNHVAGWGAIQDTFNFKLSAFKAAAETTKIELGQGLLPAAGALLDAVRNIIVPIGNWTAAHQNLTKEIALGAAGVSGFVLSVLAVAKVVALVTKVIELLRLVAVVQGVWTAAVYAFNVATDLAAVKVALYLFWSNAVKVATAAWTAAQWLLNLALNANPLGITVIAIAALVALVIIAWKRSDEFRDAVHKLWDALSKGASEMWASVKPALTELLSAFQDKLLPILRTFFDVQKVIWAAVAAAIVWAVDHVIIPLMVIWVQYLSGVLIPIFMFLWKNIVVPVFRGIVMSIESSWALIKIVWDALGVAIVAVGNFFVWLKNHAGDAWAGLSALIDSKWQTIKGIFNAVKDFITVTLPNAFRSGIDAIGNAWDSLKEKARAPVSFVVRTVINPLIEGFDRVSSVFHGPHVDTIGGFAAGGTLPGYSPGKDNMVLPLAAFSGGESVMVPEWTRAVGPDAVTQWNGAARRGGPSALVSAMRASLGMAGYADGGIIAAVTNPAKYIHGLVDGPLAGLGDFGNSPFVQVLREMPRTLADAAISRIKGLISAGASFLGGLFGGGGGGGGAAASGLLGQWIATAMSLTGVPSSWAGPLNTLIMRESGGNPNAINLTDINAQQGHPSQGLMQTIPSTFNAYRLPGLSASITDPVSNIVAGIRYILARYGSIFNVQQANANLPPMGYALGGILDANALSMDSGYGVLRPGTNIVRNGTGRLEPITSGPVLLADETMARLEDRLTRLINAVERIAPGVGRELNGTAASMRQIARSY